MKRGQFGIITFLGIFLVLLVLAPILLNIVTTMTGGFKENIGNIDPNAEDMIDQSVTKFTAFWDYVILFIFLVNVLILLISSFFIDTHPIFVLVYIFVGFLMVVFAPYTVDVVNTIWDTPRYITDGTVEQLSMTGFLLDHFGSILLLIFVLSGIIMYAKIKLMGSEYA